MEIKLPLERYFNVLTANKKRISYPSFEQEQCVNFVSFHETINSELDFWREEGDEYRLIFDHYSKIKMKLNASNDNSNVQFSKDNIKEAYDLSNKNLFPNVSKNSLLAKFLTIDLRGTSDAVRLIMNYLKSPSMNTEKLMVHPTMKFFFQLQIILNMSYISNDVISITTDMNKLKQDSTNELEDMRSSHKIHKEVLDTLESLYEQKLKLERPARYWKDYSKRKQKKGNSWLLFAVLTGLIILIYSSALLANLPGLIATNGTYQLENIIRWSLLSALIFSTFFYILRIFVKLTLSSFHLANDAEERHQLTYQYLSLLQAKAIDEKEKEIILQSLFSRADTGLLKGDSSPTMPDGLISNILKLVSSR